MRRRADHWEVTILLESLRIFWGAFFKGRSLDEKGYYIGNEHGVPRFFVNSSGKLPDLKGDLFRWCRDNKRGRQADLARLCHFFNFAALILGKHDNGWMDIKGFC